MSKLDFNYDNLSSYAIPNMDSALDNLKAAKNQAASMRIPSDFVYRNYLYGIKATISSAISTVDNVKDKIISVNSQLDDALNSFNSQTSQVDEVPIPLNDTKVNIIK